MGAKYYNYAKNHREFIDKHNLKVGDEVLITHKATYCEKGWGVGWSHNMDKLVGTVGTIIQLVSDVSSAGEGGCRLSTEDGCTWNFPYFVLQPKTKPLYEIY